MMRIDKIIVPIAIQEKLAYKHDVEVDEARQILLNQPRIRFAEQGHIPGEEYMRLQVRLSVEDT